MKVLHGISRFFRAIGHGFARFFRAIGRFCKKHKFLSVALAVVICAAGWFGGKALQARLTASTSGTYSFIRTTTLAKGTLDDTVSCTGTVESADTSTVSYSASGTGAAPKVKTVNVAVGDTVQAGDVIVTLDTSDIEESIAKEKENLADQKEKAQSSYDDAVTAYNKAVADAEAYETTLNSAQSAYTAATAPYTTASSSIGAYQSDYDTKLAAQQTAGAAYNTALSADTAAHAAYEAALAAAGNDTTAAAVIAAKGTADQADAALSTAKTTYDTAVKSASDSKALLDSVKATSNYDALAQAYTAAQQAYEQARTMMDQYEEKVTSTAKAVETAKDTLDNASSSDTLESLEEQLDACSLTAETSGKVTSLNASVGSTPSGTIATIQDTDSLKVSVTIEEADINSVSVGMTCRITSDATTDTISGTLTQIDPVAGQSGSFGAEVTVNDSDSGLLVGMNATVEIVLSSTEDCYTVPIDAVGTDDTGSFVYRQTGGSGTDMTFEKVYVTTGDSNDYYIEITSDDLADGDVIRSSSDLTQGIEETSSSEAANAGLFSSLFGGGQSGGGTAPTGGGNGGTAPTGGTGGGNMPSGGSGDMPSGGPGGGQ